MTNWKSNSESESDFGPPRSRDSRIEKHSPPGIVRDLRALIIRGHRFPTIYADPPWPYSNTAARGAAENHYRTMTLDAIRAEPVKRLAADQAHLHLWTTNAFLTFLRAAFDVLRAWGFRYKSCLIWFPSAIAVFRHPRNGGTK